MEGTISLLTERKLVLFLDIDNTLLHAIITPIVPYKLLHSKDVFVFEMGNQSGQKLYCLIKLRPGAIDFISSVSKLFKVYICTLGNLEYATEIRNRINRLVAKRERNEQWVAIEPYIISREHHVSENSTYKKGFGKFLQKTNELHILDSVAIIVDDRADIWEGPDAQANLVPIYPYSYFFQQPIYELEAAQHGISDQDVVAKIPTLNIDTNDHKDKLLRQTWNILLKIHQAYFKQLAGGVDFYKLPHISKYIKDIREKVLENVVIYPIGSKLESNLYLGVLFGAKVVSDKNDQTITHIVVQRKENVSDEDILYFDERKIAIVKKEWLVYSMKNWQRVSERDYMYHKDS